MPRRIADTEWVMVPLRIIIGFGFAAHGYAKLSRGPATFGVILKALGVPLPHFMAWLTALVELIGGIGLIAGAFVLPLTIPLTVIMITAMFAVHFQYGYSSIRLKGVTISGFDFGPIGYELNLLYVAGLLTLAMSGPTRLSFDSWLSARRKQTKVSSGKKRSTFLQNC